MTVVLEITSGSNTGHRIVLAAGQTVRVGRVDKAANYLMPDDSMMSNLHFTVEFDGMCCHMRDLNSRFGTFLNGTKVGKANVADGDMIVAGTTSFTVHFKKTSADKPTIRIASPPASVNAPPSKPATVESLVTQGRDLLQTLRSLPEPLLGLFDAARDNKVLELLQNSKEEYQSLYEGEKGEELAAFAPYLVSLPSKSSLLQALVREAWGKSWGVYLACNKTLKEVRKHLRHFLLVKLEDGREVYFRFYDPRVLRVYLSTCNAHETMEFFGPIRCYLMEGDKPETLLTFIGDHQGIKQEVVALSVRQPNNEGSATGLIRKEAEAEDASKKAEAAGTLLARDSVPIRTA